MSLKQSILAFEIQHRDDTRFIARQYRKLLQQLVNEEIRHLYNIELELRQLFLLTQIRNQRTYRADPKLDAAML